MQVTRDKNVTETKSEAREYMVHSVIVRLFNIMRLWLLEIYLICKYASA